MADLPSLGESLEPITLAMMDEEMRRKAGPLRRGEGGGGPASYQAPPEPRPTLSEWMAARGITKVTPSTPLPNYLYDEWVKSLRLK